jgi:hypothetical protein
MIIDTPSREGCFLMLPIAISMMSVAGLEGTGDVVMIMTRSEGSTFLD